MSVTGLRSLRAGRNVEQVWNLPQYRLHPRKCTPGCIILISAFDPYPQHWVGLEVWKPVSGSSSECGGKTERKMA